MRICKVEGCEKAASKGRRICGMHINRKYMYGSYEYRKWGGKKTKKITFDINKNGCFVVTSHKSFPPRYPEITVSFERMGMHRFIYKECFGDIDEELVVRHKCDNPKCINPEHLELGTVADNSRDMVTRGRSLKGEKQGNSKLTDKEVKEIKRLLAKGVQIKEISKKYNVVGSTISHIKNEKTWQHIRL